MIGTNWFLETIERVAGSPLQQGLLAALATFVLEDPTTIGCGLFVADGKMSFMTAYWGLAAGIALGDLGLYGLGRMFGPQVARWGLVSEERLSQAENWFSRNLVSAVLLSRFVPGMRLPTYLGAGILKAPVWKFLALAVAASAVWTLLLLSLSVELGEAVLPLLGRWKWPLALLAVIFVVGLQWMLARRRSGQPEPIVPTPVVSRFEFWPPYLFYIPVFLYYLGLSIRYRSPTLPTVANPSVYAGGLIGESKSQILDLIPEAQMEWVAPFIVSRGDPHQGAEERTAEIERQMSEAGLAFPVVAKPDLGQRGAGVRPVENRSQLLDYVRQFPRRADLLVQELVDHSLEAGILFYRFPNEDQGVIYSITLKSFPRVVGNGRDTIEQLIERDPRARQLKEVYLRRLVDQLQRVPGTGEEVPLVFAGNHCQGAIFRDGTPLVTASMTRRFHEIVSVIPDFYFGRFDVRFESITSLTRGEGFRIIELNGAGAEATHIWDAGFRLRDAYRVLFRQFEILFEIGHQNRKRGKQPLGLLPLARSALHYRKISRGYPLTH